MDPEWLAERFEADRARLRAVAYRMLGSASEADNDRRGRPRASANRPKSRREEPLTTEGELLPDRVNVEHEAVLAESVGAALLVVPQRLAPAERVAFVLHDLFGVSFDEIAEIVGRSPADGDWVADLARHQAILEAFFQASRRGDFQDLLSVLDPDARS